MSVAGRSLSAKGVATVLVSAWGSPPMVSTSSLPTPLVTTLLLTRAVSPPTLRCTHAPLPPAEAPQLGLHMSPSTPCCARNRHPHCSESCVLCVRAWSLTLRAGPPPPPALPSGRGLGQTLECGPGHGEDAAKIAAHLHVHEELPEVSRRQHDGGVELDDVALVQGDVMVGGQTLERRRGSRQAEGEGLAQAGL